MARYSTRLLSTVFCACAATRRQTKLSWGLFGGVELAPFDSAIISHERSRRRCEWTGDSSVLFETGRYGFARGNAVPNKASAKIVKEGIRRLDGSRQVGPAFFTSHGTLTSQNVCEFAFYPVIPCLFDKHNDGTPT